jgi:hypothetical protein
MATIGDFMKSSGREVELLRNEIAIFKNLIQERKHPLDLIRELLSNAGAREVGATRIEIGYTHAREGHIFEISDNGCGMNYTGHADLPGRLDRFLGMGMSAIVGEKSDEFSWKGLGSKLAYHSKRVEIETRFQGHPFYTVRISEPWSSLERNLLPKPYIADYADSDEKPGTRIKVTGHPPHRQGEPFTFAEIKAFLLHRTFAGYTRPRDNPPQIMLSVLGQTEELAFGLPEFRDLDWPNGIVLERDRKRLLVNIVENSSMIGLVCLKGFLVWEGDKYGLSKINQNTGLILSSHGIPYFELDLEEYGARSIQHANPGIEKVCLVVEADGVHSKMNISRSGLVDAAETLELKKAVKKLFESVETSPDYLEFRQIPKIEKQFVSADYLAGEKKAIESEDQNWVLYQRTGHPPLVLMREPKNETEVLGLLWKMECLNGLPFECFQTLAYVGAAKGPDLLVNFQEEKGSEPTRGTVIEVENKFYNYKSHGHKPSQYPKVVCWDIPSSGRKARIGKTSKKFKWTVNMEEYQVHIYVIRMMDGISVLSRRELKEMGVEI